MAKLQGGEQEEWFDPAFLDRLRALFSKLRRRPRRRRTLPHGRAGAQTREFRDYRAYSINDDFRSVDWRVYARLGRLVVRMFEEEEEYQVHLLLDASSSMASPHPAKRQSVLRLAVALGYLALMGNHRVSLHTMRDRVTTVLPALRGPGSIHRVIDVLRAVEFSGITDLRGCFEGFRPRPQRYGVNFVLSDLLGAETGAAEQALRRAGKWPGETHVIQVLDPAERAPDWEGELRFTDVETGEERKLWLSARDQQRYRELFEAYLEGVERACAARRVDYQLWMTDLGFEDFFTSLMDRGSVLGGRG